MIHKNIDLVTPRTPVEAIGFYFFILFTLVGLATVLTYALAAVGVIAAAGAFFAGGAIYTTISLAFILVMSTLMLTGRKLTGDMFAIILVLVAFYLTYTMSVWIGLIPVALLTTIKK